MFCFFIKPPVMGCRPTGVNKAVGKCFGDCLSSFLSFVAEFGHLNVCFVKLGVFILNDFFRPKILQRQLSNSNICACI